jgi:hypothetical protein
MISIVNILGTHTHTQNTTSVSNGINHTHKITWDLKEEELSVHCVLER